MHLLLVSPRFPPSNAADSQRLRMLLPHFTAVGCTAEVLAVDPRCSANELDPWQAAHLPPEVPIHRVRGLSLRWARLPGLGSVDARCHRALAHSGSRLLRKRRFDLVYFSTTEFGSFRLGPLWKRRHGVPFVLDYQDPWVNDHYRRHPDISPPGGRLKHAISDRLHRFHEPRVLRHAAGITAVSPAYPAQLQDRYPFTTRTPSVVLPFPGSPTDFDHLGTIPPNQLPFDPQDGLIHWVSIGRGGDDLHTALNGLFSAISQHAPLELRRQLRLHFIGTSYAPPGRGLATIFPVAKHYDLQDIVVEQTERLPLSIALATLKAADALMVIGSNDPSYTASKLNPYLLAQRPLLAILHERSPAAELLMSSSSCKLATFNESTGCERLSLKIKKVWLENGQYCANPQAGAVIGKAYLAQEQAKELVMFFRTCI